ncbi:MAG: tRNA-(ms[2]io[6]A)-hydroxylase [Bradymonadales bacterium]|nr:MAG: tRNA-(ms[2]io[6]A)-hydroxylase [Bradymonadales bacterium]
MIQLETAHESPLEIRLLAKTSPAWISQVLEKFDLFLVDHAACERKASATAIQFVVKYPDRLGLVDPMIRLAREELLHFHQVARLLLERKISIGGDEKDPYINLLLGECRHGRDEHFLDRLLCFGVVEARGTERFGLVAENHPDSSLRRFYRKLTEAEARHHQSFVDLACLYFEQEQVEERLRFLLQREAEIVSVLKLRPAVH